MRVMLKAVVVAGVVMFGVSASAAFAACREDLVATSQNLKRTREGIEGATKGNAAAQCVAYRRHVASLTQVRAVFARCDSSADKAKNAAQVGATLAQTNKDAQQACKK